jgi:hypothetical protein
MAVACFVSIVVCLFVGYLVFLFVRFRVPAFLLPFLEALFFDAAFLAPFFPAFFLGTFAPARLASESPMAIACLRLFTFLPLRPLLRVPRFRSRMFSSTFSEAFLEYFAMAVENQILFYPISIPTRVPLLGSHLKRLKQAVLVGAIPQPAFNL